MQKPVSGTVAPRSNAVWIAFRLDMSSISSSLLCDLKTDVLLQACAAHDECWGRLVVALALMSGPSAHVLGADGAGKEGPNAYAPVDIDGMVRDNAAVAERRRADGMVVGRSLDFLLRVAWRK